MIKRFFLKILTALTCLCLVTNAIPAFNNIAIAATDNNISDNEDTTFYYIDTNGDNNNDGSFTAPLKDLYGLKDKLISNIDEIKNNINVIINEGTYYMDKQLIINTYDLNNKKFNLNLVSMGDVIITGAITLDNSKIYSSVINNKHVYVCDLSDYNLNFDYDKNSINNAPELFINDNPMTLARYPNEDYLTTNTIVNTDLDNIQFTSSSDINFASSEKNLYIRGCLLSPWEYLTKKCTINNNIITLNESLNYSVPTNKYFYIENGLSLLDTDNEYYIDYENKKLYFISDYYDANTNLKLSLTNGSLLTFYFFNGLNIENINFECSRSSAINVYNSNNFTINNCNLYNCSNTALFITDSENCIVTNCNIYNNGGRGIFIKGGNRDTLTSSNNIISNNIIHDCNRIFKSDAPGISAYGVGININNNTIYNLSGIGILYFGNNHIIQNNNVYNVCRELGDTGAIYAGNDWCSRGNLIDSNFIHDSFLNYSNEQIVGIYLDDCMSSAEVSNNKIDNFHTGMLFGGGRDNNIHDNTISNCTNSLIFDNRLMVPGWLSDSGLNYNLSTVPYNSNIWIKSYPEIATLDTTNRAIPYNNTITNNKLINSPEMIISEYVKQYGNVSN